MTTIVYRDGTLAADRFVTQNAVLVGYRCKIEEVRSHDSVLLGWVACCGWPTDNAAAAEWLSKWPRLEPAPKRIQENDATGFFLVKPGGFWMLGGMAPFQTEADFHAAGSGFEIAMGALAMGATAEEAVEVASVYDHGTGGGVDSVRAA